MDWIVLVTPLLALAVVALLGYTGCDRVLGLQPVDPVPPTATILMQTRVPTAVPVTLCRYRFKPPMATGYRTEVSNETAIDGTDTLYRYRLDGAIGGEWEVNCHLEATNPGGSTVVRNAGGTFVLDPAATPEVEVNFVTVGMPGQGDAYQLEYRGVPG